MTTPRRAGPPDGNGRRSVQWRRWEPRRTALLVGGAAALIALVADRWHSRIREAEARSAVTARMAPFVEALQGAVDRRLGLLTGLRSFAESRRSRSALDEEFPLFASGSLTGVQGVRALQLVERGRIVATWPIAGNEAVLGYDLLADPRPRLGADVRRAMSTGRVTVTGPIALVQGGTGLLVRQRIAPRAGFPELAAIVLDVPSLLDDAGIPAAAPGLVLELLDRDGAWFAGAVAGSAVDPVVLPVRVEDGDWTLRGSPAGGWGAMTAAPRRAFRLAAAALVLAAAMLGFVVGTRERQLVREVQDAGSQLAFAMRAARMGSWEWDVRTNAVRWSEAAAQILGFDAASEPDPIARFFSAVHPEDRETVRQVVGATARGTQSHYNIEYRVRRADGSLRWVLAIGELERDAKGTPAVLAGVIWDSTARRDLEDRVRHADRMEAIGQLAGGVAHDFNNLLTAMRAFADLARDRAADLGDSAAANEVREDLGELLATIERGAAITSQLLAFSRRQPVAPRPLDLSAAVAEVVPMLGRLLTSRITLDTDLAEGLPPVLMDPGQLTQVLMNLLVNARDAMPDGGRIALRTRSLPAGDPAVPAGGPQGPTVCVEVEDNGTGMTAEVTARIFEPFFTTKEPGKGTGLGLPVVLAAVERASGVITVHSIPGKGTTFRIFLPAHRT